MNIDEIKNYLETELPDFIYKTDDSTNIQTGLQENINKIWVERDGQYIVLDISKVVTKKDLKQLKSFIELKWRSVGI